MAERRKTSKKQRFGEFRERFCDYNLCSKLKGRSVKAIAYCPVCNQFLCESCQIIHGTTAGTKNHQVLIGEEMINFEDDILPKYGYCSDHTGYRRDLFCSEHKEMICSKCRKVSHSRCVVKFIQEATKSVSRADINALKAEIRNFKRDLQFASTTLDNNIGGIEEQRKLLLKKNQETYDILIDNLSKLFDNIATEIERTCSDLTAKLNDQKEQLKEIISSLESNVYAVEISKDKEMAPNVFIGLQGVVQQARQNVDKVEEMFKHFGVVQLSYKPSKQLNDILNSSVHFVSIGIRTTEYKNPTTIPNITFPVTSIQPADKATPANTLKFIERHTDSLDTLAGDAEKVDTLTDKTVEGQAIESHKIIESPKSIDSPKNEINIEALKPTGQKIQTMALPPTETRFVPRPLHISTMKARFHQTFNVKINSDRYNCWIRGSAITRDGKILLTDSNNHNVKLFSPEMRLLSFLILPDAPWDISIYRNNACVVSILKNNELYFIDFSDDSLKIKSSLKLHFDVFGVTKCRDKLCVTCLSEPPSVKLIDRSGKVHWYANVDNKGKKLFKRPWYITSFVKDNEMRIIVTDKEAETVTYLDGDTGKVICVRPVKGKDPNGVTTDYSGNIYVCYHGTDKICVMSGDITKGRILLSMQDGLRACPYAIVYDPNMSRLIISNNSNKVDSYKLS